MKNGKPIELLVGDNPFHGISHLSQARRRARGNESASSDYAANLVLTSLANEAQGFMFSVSETTLSILKKVWGKGNHQGSSLYAIVPYAYEYVRLATQTGGISGLARKIGMQILSSGNVKAIVLGLKGFARMEPESLLKTYVAYEVSRIKAAVGGNARLDSLILHEIITEMGLALDLDWLFVSYIRYMEKLGIRPGFESRNFAFMIDRFEQWGIDLSKTVLVAPFNAVGFQMNPSRGACEDALKRAGSAKVVAMSILAAGYLKLPEAIEYVKGLPNIGAVVVGVSKEHHARETFKLLSERLNE